MIPISLSILAYILVGLLGAVAGAAVYEFIRRRAALGRRVESEEQARQILQSAQREAETVTKEAKLEAKDLIFQARTEVERDQKAKLAELSSVEKRLVQREEALDKKVSIFEKREGEISKRDQELMRREDGLGQKEVLCAQG